MERIDSNYGNIANINGKKTKTVRKIKLDKKSCGFALAASAVIFFAGLGIGKAMQSNNITQELSYTTLEYNKIMTTISVGISMGDTISGFADTYYNDSYESVFGSKENFEMSIQLQNKLANSKIKIGDKLNIPVIIDNDNPYLQNIMELKTKIANIEQNNYWVKHTVTPNDTLSDLAALASGSVAETIENTNKIAKKNGLNADMINFGDEILIINPELGSLKIELLDAQKLLIDSLKNNVKTK